MLKFVAYLRVSTERQGLAGLGIDAQRASIDALARTRSAEVVATYLEVESGGRRDRPELTAALAHAKREGAILAVAKLDRLARNVAFVSSLMESNIEFVAADAPHASRLVLHLLAAFAEHEKGEIASRTRAALAAAKARGVVLGSNGKALAAAALREVEEFAREHRDTVADIWRGGRPTVRRLAQELNARGIATPNGCSWRPGNAARLMKRLREVGAVAA